MGKILIVEDDETIRNGLMIMLTIQGYIVDCAVDGKDAVEKFDDSYNLVVMDVLMPRMSGIDACRKMRDISNVPILFLTAKSSEIDKIQGFDAGADDYLTKPFSVEELLARLRVTQRRLAMMQGEVQTESAIFQNGSLRIDYAAGCAYLDGEELHLTPIEYKLLSLLSKNVGKVLTHTFITQKIWGSSWDNDVASLRVFMATLRKKIEKQPNAPQYIQTHIGVGYRMLKVE